MGGVPAVLSTAHPGEAALSRDAPPAGNPTSRRERFLPLLRPVNARRLRRGILIPLAAFLTAPLPAQVIRGRVVEAGTGRGIPVARIAAVAADGQVLARTISAADGSFSVGVTPEDPYRIVVGRTGYGELRSTELKVGRGDTVDVELRLAARTLRLEGITITGRAVRRRVRELDLSGSYRRPRVMTSGAAVDSATASGERGRIVVRGSFAAPDECFRLQGSVSTDPRTVELTIEARPGREDCAGAGGAILYDSAVHGLARGTYLLRVVHSAAGQQSRVVLQGSVTVR
jgi:hypothetical protein